MFRKILILAAVVAIQCAACAAPASTGPSTGPTNPERTAATTVGPTPAPSPFPDDDAFADLVRHVASGGAGGPALDALWQTVFERGSVPAAYRSPTAVIGYRAGEIPESACAARTTVSYWLDNARYCEADRTILYDEDWLRNFEARFGAFAPAAILAHEWGHHIQALIGSSVVSNQFELQADCFAGMFLAASEEVEPGRYEIGDNLGAALKTFFDIGNAEYEASEWFAAGEHGSRSQRMMAFGTGYLPVLGGLPWCYGYRDFKPQDVASIGPYRLLNLPGRAELSDGGAYAILADDRSGQATSNIVLEWLERVPLAGEGATLAQLRELWRLGYPGLTPLYEAINLDANVGDGTGVAQFMENRVAQADGSELIQHGFFALVSPRDAVGGLVILVARPGTAPTDPLDDADFAMIEEGLVAVYQVINRLCGPDQSGGPSNPDLNVACLDDQ